MRIFQGTFQTRKRSFISAFSICMICMTVPINNHGVQKLNIVTFLAVLVPIVLIWALQVSFCRG